MDEIALTAQTGLADLPRIEHLDPADVAPVFIERVPIAYARQFCVVGLQPDNGCVRVVVGSDDALVVVDKIAVVLGMPTRAVRAASDHILTALNHAYGQVDSGVDAVIDGLDTSDATALLEELRTSSDLLDSAAASPVTRLVNMILLESVKRRASDVHIQPCDDRVQVRMRIDGVLDDYVSAPQALHDEIVSRIKVMGRMNIAEKRLAQDGRTTVQVGDRVIDLRISSLPTSHGERAVLRLLDKSARLYRLAELGLGQANLATFRNLIQHTHGIILVTGPTGSGKTTTLYAALQELDHEALNTLTLEDPIEYQLPGISQTQVSQYKGMTFATGLRTVLRQDPDVIMVGEIRDEETARMAIQSSLTGHLVFSTLHTNDAAGAVARLLDLGVEPYLVAGSLLGVMAQRLVRRVCDQCKTRRPFTAHHRALLRLPDTLDISHIHEAHGCPSCEHRGYRDRKGIFELLVVNERIQDLIASRAKSRDIKAAAAHRDMMTLRQSALQKLADGMTTIEEVLRITHHDAFDMEHA